MAHLQFGLSSGPGTVTAAVASEGVRHERDLVARVKSNLLERQHPSLRTVVVEAEGDTIVLRGTVSSYYVRQLAVHCSLAVAGVQQVIDFIDVQ